MRLPESGHQYTAVLVHVGFQTLFQTPCLQRKHQTRDAGVALGVAVARLVGQRRQGPPGRLPLLPASAAAEGLPQCTHLDGIACGCRWRFEEDFESIWCQTDERLPACKCSTMGKSQLPLKPAGRLFQTYCQASQQAGCRTSTSAQTVPMQLRWLIRHPPNGVPVPWMATKATSAAMTPPALLKENKTLSKALRRYPYAVSASWLAIWTPSCRHHGSFFWMK